MLIRQNCLAVYHSGIKGVKTKERPPGVPLYETWRIWDSQMHYSDSKSE